MPSNQDELLPPAEWILERAAGEPCHRTDYGWTGTCESDSGPDMHYACVSCLARAWKANRALIPDTPAELDKCVKCGHNNRVNGTCQVWTHYGNTDDPNDHDKRCGCHCEFTDPPVDTVPAGDTFVDIYSCPNFKLPASFTFDPNNTAEQIQIAAAERQHEITCPLCSRPAPTAQGEVAVPRPCQADEQVAREIVGKWLAGATSKLVTEGTNSVYESLTASLATALLSQRNAILNILDSDIQQLTKSGLYDEAKRIQLIRSKVDENKNSLPTR